LFEPVKGDFHFKKLSVLAAEQRPIVAHGANRGNKCKMIQSPGGVKEIGQMCGNFLSLLRSFFQTTRPTHSSRCGLLSDATPWL
jgi:hypothetical protein